MVRMLIAFPRGIKKKQTNKYFLSCFALVRSAFLFSSPNSLHKCFYTLVKRRGFLHTKSSQIIYGNNAKSKENQQVLTKHSLKWKWNCTVIKCIEYFSTIENTDHHQTNLWLLQRKIEELLYKFLFGCAYWFQLQ